MEIPKDDIHYYEEISKELITEFPELAEGCNKEFFEWYLRKASCSLDLNESIMLSLEMLGRRHSQSIQTIGENKLNSYQRNMLATFVGLFFRTVFILGVQYAYEGEPCGSILNFES